MNKESRRNFVKKTAVLSTATLATTLPVDAFANVTAVSYTHLTLPTSDLV